MTQNGGNCERLSWLSTFDATPGETDETEGYDCGDEPLNNYLYWQAWINQQKSSI